MEVSSLRYSRKYTCTTIPTREDSVLESPAHCYVSEWTSFYCCLTV